MRFRPILRQWLTPVSTAFAGSLLLSLIALFGSTLNRDGMLYVQTAQLFLDSGFPAAIEKFGWPFLSISMALVSRLSGLGLETTGHLLNALFMAGTCALMVSCARHREPAIAWSVCLVTIALPGLNEYRSELLREYGCWFFVMLAFWLALNWSDKPRWATAFSVQVSLGVAALFRPEALALFPALIAWQIIAAPKAERWKRLTMLGAIPIAVGVILLVLHLGGHLSSENRLASDLGRLSAARFDAKAQALAEALIEYAKDQARTILFFGSLALIPIKLLEKLGVFVIPFALLVVSREARTSLARHSVFAWAIVAHLVVLAVFVTDLQFLAGRYVGLILLLSAPFVGTGFWLMMRRYPRWRWLILLTAIVMMLANVVSTSTGKVHFVSAGRWLSENATESSQVYIDSGRTAYYADWKRAKVAERNGRDVIEHAVANKLYNLFVLEISRKDPPIDEWLTKTGLVTIKRFDHPNRDAVIVAKPIARNESDVARPANNENPSEK